MSFGRGQPLRRALALLPLAWLGWACGAGTQAPDPEYQRLSSAGIEEPQNEFERELLRRLPELAPGEPAAIAGGEVVADRPYAAASGRSCRQLVLTPPGASSTSFRLACLIDGAWALVPDVLAPSSPPAAEAAPEPISRSPGEAEPLDRGAAP